jgi:hypothetical protein
MTSRQAESAASDRGVETMGLHRFTLQFRESAAADDRQVPVLPGIDS